MTFSEAVRGARLRAGLTQKGLAAAAGVSQSAVASVEAGRRNTFARETVIRMEVALGLHPGSLAAHLPPDHLARELATADVPDCGVVWGNRIPPDVPEPEPGKVFRLTGRFPPGTFVLRVSGHSVHQYGVHDGDVIAVRPTAEPEEGRLVIARVGNAYTIKGCKAGRLYSFGKGDAAPVEMDGGDTYEVVGVMIEVVSGVRRFVPKSGTLPRRGG